MFKIFDKNKIDNTVYFKLQVTSQGISLFTCREDGSALPQGQVLTVTETGRLYRAPHINPALGLQLDKVGRIEISGLENADKDPDDKSLKTLHEVKVRILDEISTTTHSTITCPACGWESDRTYVDYSDLKDLVNLSSTLMKGYTEDNGNK